MNVADVRPLPLTGGAELHDWPAGFAIEPVPVSSSLKHRSQTTSELNRRTAMLYAIGDAAKLIVGGADWRVGIQELLDRLGEATGVSRVSLFEIHRDWAGRPVETCRYDYAEPGLLRLTGDPRFQNIALVDEFGVLDEWTERRQRGETVQAVLSELTGLNRDFFLIHNTKSFLSVPIMLRGGLWGFLGFDDCHGERVWSRLEIDVLETAAALTAGAIERARADDKLHESQRLLVEAQRIAHVGSWELDFATELVTWSDEGWRIFGLEPGQGSWSHAENLQCIHPDDRERVAQADALARERGLPFDVEYRILRAGGEVRVVYERAEPLCDDTGRPVRLIGTVHDITDVKATEAKLRVSEERYSLAARGANDGLWDWDLATASAYFSPRLHEILAIPEDGLGTDIAALFDKLHPDDARATEDYLCKRMAQRRRRFRFESRLRGLAEPPRWVVARGLIVYDGTRPVRVVGSLRDISAHKQALADLRDREARSRAILDTAMDAIISVDMNGRVVEFNAAATRIFGIPHEQAIGQSIGELIVPPQQQAAHAHGMRRFLETGKSTIVGRMIEVEAMHASGSLIPIEMSVAEVAGPSGRMFTAILRDISERKEFERQLSESEGKRARLARHFSPNMVNELMRGGDHLTRVQTRPIGVLFADIVGFTAMSQTMPGPDIIAMLRDFHALVENAVFSSDGTLDKYIGDGVMATFGTPRSGPRDATNAVDCALKLLNGVTDWNGRRQSAGEKPVQIGIGLHYGDATSGNVGSDKRLEFTVIGDTVNLASRIESLSRKLQTAIVASHDIVEAVRREGGDEVLIDFDDVGVHPIRGRSTPVRLWGMAAEAASKTAAR